MAGQNKPIGIAYSDPDLTELYLDGVEVTATAAQINSAGTTAPATAGTVEASKAVVVDANKDAAAFRTVGVVNLDAGSSGVAGTVDIFPNTASKGKIAITAVANTSDDTLTIVNAEIGQATTLTIPDPDAATGSFVISTGTTTKISATSAELEKAAGVTAGTSTASKNAVLGASKNLDILGLPVSGLKIGPAASEVVVTCTAAEFNKLTGIPSSVTVVVTTPGASGTCDAAFTFKDAAGDTIAIPVALSMYLSGVDGLTITAAITSIAAADTPVGAVGAVTTGQQGLLITTAGGLASVKLTGTAATTYYLTFLGLGGRLIVSPALLTKA